VTAMIYIALLFGHLRRSSNRSSGGGIFGATAGGGPTLGNPNYLHFLEIAG